MSARSHLILLAASAGLAGAVVLAPPAEAIGCFTGGAAGAVAGHYAHHHGVIGALGGCIAGHEAHKHMERKRAEARREHEYRHDYDYDSRDRDYRDRDYGYR